METLTLYLLKASAVLGLFLLTYQVLLKRETHFRLNRIFLLGGLLVAPLLPLVTIKRTVAIPFSEAAASAGEPALQLGQQAAQGFPWEPLLLAVYMAGALGCALAILKQLFTLRQLIEPRNMSRKDGFVYVASRRIEAPFSFFRYIFYNPDRHSGAELPFIFEHEKAHGAQYHTLDILMSRLVSALLWVNPLSWWYQKSVAQNLEYLADSRAVRSIPSVREYQYTLLRVSGNAPTPALANAFNSSLIKKRIIMLHQTQSKSIRMIRHLLILPLLAAFLVAFNTETVYVPEDLPADYLPGTGDKTVELTIDKNTTDAELTEIKEKLGKDQIDFSYTTVRNEAREIISLTLYLAGKNSQGKSFSGSYQSGDDTPIEPVLVHYDDSRNSVSFSSGGSHDSGLHMHSGNADKMVWITADDDEGGDAKEHKIVVRSRDSRDGNVMVWRSGDEPTREIEIRQVEGDTLIMVNGKEVSKAEWHEMDDSGDKVHKIKVSKTVKRDGKHVMVFRDSDDDADIEVIDGGSGGFFFIDSGKGEKPLFYIDGKKASEKQVRALKPDAIEKIEVLKGDQATSEYGKKAKDGVVLITTKSK